MPPAPPWMPWEHWKVKLDSTGITAGITGPIYGACRNKMFLLRMVISRFFMLSSDLFDGFSWNQWTLARKWIHLPMDLKFCIPHQCTLCLDVFKISTLSSPYSCTCSFFFCYSYILIAPCSTMIYLQEDFESGSWHVKSQMPFTTPSPFTQPAVSRAIIQFAAIHVRLDYYLFQCQVARHQPLGTRTAVQRPPLWSPPSGQPVPPTWQWTLAQPPVEEWPKVWCSERRASGMERQGMVNHGKPKNQALGHSLAIPVGISNRAWIGDMQTFQIFPVDEFTLQSGLTSLQYV